ncbi:hypothetical protein NAP1_13393 [Erythrobacter sp. NAP1]|nr:hypothetical protein [Erythrobacter sp. NAP1]EAQ28596.1 hypothetical protein NAP1_13393 [Erythrobacter sp. NAP1]
MRIIDMMPHVADFSVRRMVYCATRRRWAHMRNRLPQFHERLAAR